ncbi:MAG: hypothetical protein KC910_33070, partial [Candidatus Eremiobacteraeota bacterium]|nr:hypothetical protein [Candidatus Eremiobacteraeota bacterium]
MKCEQCSESNLPEAKYCEACGHELGTEPENDSPSSPIDSGESSETRPGSLRDEIPFLTGAVDQARARIEDWKQKSARKQTEKVREREFREQAAASESKGEGAGLGQRVMTLLVGILAIAAFIY